VSICKFYPRNAHQCVSTQTLCVFPYVSFQPLCVLPYSSVPYMSVQPYALSQRFSSSITCQFNACMSILMFIPNY
jgi:hypothetical protein